METNVDFAPTLEKYLDDRNIQGVCFDLDNTVFDTDGQYLTLERQCFLEIAQKFPYPNENPKNTAENISNLAWDEYIKRSLKPFPIAVESLDGVIKYYKSLYNPEMEKMIHEYFYDFHDKCPDFLPNAKELFTYLFNYKNMKLMVGNSLARRDWTGVKINTIKKECGIDELPYFTTDIDKPKDWGKALQYMCSKGLEYENILVMGDNLESDIIPAIKEGIKHVIWLDKRRRAAEHLHKLSSKAEIAVVHYLKEVFNLQ